MEPLPPPVNVSHVTSVFFFHSHYKIVSSSKRFLIGGISEQYVLLLHLSWFFCRKFNEKPLHLLG